MIFSLIESHKAMAISPQNQRRDFAYSKRSLFWGLFTANHHDCNA